MPGERTRKVTLDLVSTDTPVRNQGPGRSLPGPDSGHPLHGAGGHGAVSRRPRGVRSTCDSERPTTVMHGQSWSLDGCGHETAGAQRPSRLCGPCAAPAGNARRLQRSASPMPRPRSPPRRDGACGACSRPSWAPGRAVASFVRPRGPSRPPSPSAFPPRLAALELDRSPSASGSSAPHRIHADGKAGPGHPV